MPPIFDKSKAAGIAFCTLATFLSHGSVSAEPQVASHPHHCVDPSDYRESESIYLESDLTDLLESEQESFLVSEDTPNTSTDSINDISPRLQKLQNYLERISIEGAISEDTKIFAWNVWQQLNPDGTGSIEVPNAGPGPNGELFYEWDRNQHHLTLEILPTGEREFFYRNSETGEIWDADFETGEAFDYERVKEKLNLFS